MRELPPNRDASHEASILVALRAAGIEPVVHRTSFDSNGVPTYSHIFVGEEDYDRALAAIGGIQATPLILPDSGLARAVRITFVIVVLAVAAQFVYRIVRHA